LPVILCVRLASDQERAFWARTVGEGRIGPGDLEQALELMKRHGALEATLERARRYGALARDALASLPPGLPQQALIEVVEFCVTRAS
jgi:octaprenyl-diphosphate synthase